MSPHRTFKNYSPLSQLRNVVRRPLQGRVAHLSSSFSVPNDAEDAEARREKGRRGDQVIGWSEHDKPGTDGILHPGPKLFFAGARHPGYRKLLRHVPIAFEDRDNVNLRANG